MSVSLSLNLLRDVVIVIWGIRVIEGVSGDIVDDGRSGDTLDSDNDDIISTTTHRALEGFMTLILEQPEIVAHVVERSVRSVAGSTRAAEYLSVQVMLLTASKTHIIQHLEFDFRSEMDQMFLGELFDIRKNIFVTLDSLVANLCMGFTRI